MNNSKSTHKSEIWEYFYRKEDKKPVSKAAFLETIVENKDYILTDGMENLVRNKLLKITKSQMRNLFEEIKNTKKSELTRLRIKLIYTAGRINAKEFICLLIDILQENFDFGKDLMESALAYHKFHADK